MSKDTSKSGKPERVAAPHLPEELQEAVSKDNFVIWIGGELSRSVRPSSYKLPTYPDLLQQLIEHILDATQREEISRLLSLQDSASIQHAAEEIKTTLGPTKFYFFLSRLLSSSDSTVEETLPYKLLRLLKPKCILTTNTDRFLEKFASTEDVHVLTSTDMEALKIDMNSIEDRPMILKLHGDISRPITIPFTDIELYSQYGLKPDLSPLDQQTVFSKYFTGFLKSLFNKYTVLFIGTNFNTNDPIVNLMKLWNDKQPKSIKKHFALVERTKESVEQIGLETIFFDSDDKQTQIWEFLARVNSSKTILQPIPGKEWERSYLSEERSDYLAIQLEKEKVSTDLCFFTPSLTNSITTNTHLEELILPSLLRTYSPETTAKVMEYMHSRKGNLEERILGTEDCSVKVMFLESCLLSDFDTKKVTKQTMEYNLKRYEHMLSLYESSKGKLEVKLVPILTPEQLKGEFEASYALIYYPNIAKGKFKVSDVAMAFASQANVKYFEYFQIQLFYINTIEVRTKMVQFDRCWNAAVSVEESVKRIKNVVEQVKKGGKL